MVDKPLVSVVIPVYNTGIYIKNILKSIKCQTYNNIELILVDDGSKDNSVEIINNELAECSINWTLIKQNNGGVSKARNLGIENAKGEWLICPDSDDWVAADTIEYMITSAIENNAQCAFCEYKEVNEKEIESLPCYNNGIEILSQNQFKYHNLLRKTCVIFPGMVIRRDIFTKIKFDECCPYSEDTLYTWELVYQVKKVVWVKSDLYNYLNREGSKQHSLSIDKCILSLERYRIMTSSLIKKYPNDSLAKKIQPKFLLGAMHVLSRCNSFVIFKKVYSQTDKNEVKELYCLKNAKLSIFSFLYFYSPYLFYKISRIR